MPQFSPYDIRHRASAAMRGHWQSLLVIALIAQIPGLVGMLFLNSMPTTVGDKILSVLSGTLTNVEDLVRLNGLIDQWIATEGAQMLAVNLLLALLNPMFAINVITAVMMHFREEDTTLSIYRKTFKLWLPALGIAVVTWIKMILWALPGLIISAGIPMIMLLQANDQAAILQALSSITYLVSLGSILTAVLTIMAYYRYMLAPYVLADQHIGVFASIRESKRLTQKRKFTLFATLSTYYLLFLAGMYLSSILAGALGNVLADLIWLFVQLILIVYSYSVTASFYLRCKEIE